MSAAAWGQLCVYSGISLRFSYIVDMQKKFSAGPQQDETEQQRISIVVQMARWVVRVGQGVGSDR